MFNKKSKELPIKSKDERFKNVASRRVQNILNQMRLLRNCANKNNYYYTDEQVRKIFSAVDDEWKKVKSEFNKGKNKGKEFNL